MKHPLPELLLLLLLAATAAYGQTGGEIVLRADRASIDQQAGTGVYEGNAEMTQGERHLSAEQIFIRLENGEISRVEAVGEPVRLTEGEALNARAQRLVYDLEARMIHLFDDAYVSHEGRTFEGARVRYDLQSRQVEASGDDKGRVRLVIPGSENDNAQQQQGEPSP